MPRTALLGRALTELPGPRELTRPLPPRETRVLEIGCESRSLLLAAFGYSGSYVSVDVTDPFGFSVQSDLRREFVNSNAHRFEPKDRLDLMLPTLGLVAADLRYHGRNISA